MTDHEFDHIAKEMKAILRPELVLIAEVRGEPVAFSMTLPDANFALKAAGGRLTRFGLPIGLLKLILASRRIRRLRLITLCIKEGFRKRGIDAVLYLDTLTTAKRLGYSGRDLLDPGGQPSGEPGHRDDGRKEDQDLPHLPAGSLTP
jgi:hypothetical protein